MEKRVDRKEAHALLDWIAVLIAILGILGVIYAAHFYSNPGHIHPENILREKTPRYPM
jgi:hypothetical protein